MSKTQGGMSKAQGGKDTSIIMQWRYRFTVREERLLWTAMIWADQHRSYIISGYHVRIAAVRLAKAKLLRMRALPELPGRKRVRHLAVRPTQLGREVLAQHWQRPLWKPPGGDTRSENFRANQQQLLAQVAQLGRL